MTNLISLLNNAKNISDWRIAEVEKTSYEVFFVHRSLETVRATDTVDTVVTVYCDHDDKMGDSTFNVYASNSEEEIKQKIEKAAARAALVFNEPYTLPENESLCHELESNFAEYEPRVLAEKMADAVFAADCYEGGSINATEIFINKIKKTVRNSRGIDKCEIKYTAMIEAIPTWNEGDESVELYEQYNFTEFDAADITAEIDRRMKEVRDRQVAKKPESEISCPVVLNPDELANLFGELVGDLSFSAVYSHANVFSKGDKIQGELTGDPITVTASGAVKGSPRSAVFDGDGVTLEKRTVIENGVAVANHGDNRFAQYLGEKPTGNLGCVEVACGTLSDAELKSAPYFECASLSGLQLDMYNDYIGGEIRLGYYFDGEKTVPVTGVSMSGKLSCVLESIRLSDRETVKGAYKGPDKAVLLGMKIL